MITKELLQNIWVVDILWCLVYLSDYYLTIYTARQFQTTLKDHISFEGSFELTPTFQKDVDQLRLFSRNFYLRLLLTILALSLLWWLAIEELELPQFFYFATGAIFLREAVVILRHARNVALAAFSKSGDHLIGKMGYSRWLTLRLSFAEIASFAVFFLLVSIGVGSWFFLGGALACTVTALSHYRMSSKLENKKILREMKT